MKRFVVTIFFLTFLASSNNNIDEVRILDGKQPSNFYRTTKTSKIFNAEIFKKKYIKILKLLRFSAENIKEVKTNIFYSENFDDTIIAVFSDTIPTMHFDKETGELLYIGEMQIKDKQINLSREEIEKKGIYFFELLKDYTNKNDFTISKFIPDKNMYIWKRVSGKYEYDKDFIHLELNNDGTYYRYYKRKFSNEWNETTILITKKQAFSIMNEYLCKVAKKEKIDTMLHCYTKFLIVNPNDFIQNINNHDTRLAYEIFMQAKQSEDCTSSILPTLKIWIDAENGDVLGGYKAFLQ